MKQNILWRSKKICLPGIFALNFLEFHVHLAQRHGLPDLKIWLLNKKVNIHWNSATVLLWVISTRQIQVHGDHQPWEVSVTKEGSLKCWRNRLMGNSWNSPVLHQGWNNSRQHLQSKEQLCKTEPVNLPRGTEGDCMPLEQWQPTAQELHQQEYHRCVTGWLCSPILTLPHTLFLCFGNSSGQPV